MIALVTYVTSAELLHDPVFVRIPKVKLIFFENGFSILQNDIEQAQSFYKIENPSCYHITSFTFLVTSAGFEPTSSEPESEILSLEL